MYQPGNRSAQCKHVAAQRVNDVAVGVSDNGTDAVYVVYYQGITVVPHRLITGLVTGGGKAGP